MHFVCITIRDIENAEKSEAEAGRGARLFRTPSIVIALHISFVEYTLEQYGVSPYLDWPEFVDRDFHRAEVACV